MTLQINAVPNRIFQGSHQGSAPESWEVIATIPGLALPSHHVRNMLMSAHMFYAIEGSLGYDVRIDTGNVQRATALLTEDVRKHPYYYLSVKGYRGRCGFVDKSKWKILKVKINLKSIEKSKELKSDSNLRGLVLQARHDYESYEQPKQKHPFVSEIRFVPIEYLNAKGKWENGVFGEVTIRSNNSKWNRTSMSWSWDQGRKGTYSF